MCKALQKNDKLKVITEFTEENYFSFKVLIVTPVKTDLPAGLVGELVDWSQDHSKKTK
jgi:hypothetical protein